MGKTSRLQQSVHKSKAIANLKGRPALACLPAQQVEDTPRSISVHNNAFFLRAMYRRARERLARPQSAPAGGKSFRQCADAVRRSSRDVSYQRRVVQWLQDCVLSSRASPGEDQAPVEDVMPAYPIRTAFNAALLNLELPKDVRDVGSAVDTLQTITSLCKDEKLGLAELHATCAKLLEKNNELAAGLEATLGYTDYARRLQDEISKTLEALRAHAGTCSTSGDGAGAARISAASVAMTYDAYEAALRDQSMNDAVHDSVVACEDESEDECNEQSTDATTLSHRQGGTVLPPIAPEEHSGERRPSFLSMVRTTSRSTSTEDDDKAQESAAGDEDNGRTETAAEVDSAASESRSSEQGSSVTGDIKRPSPFAPPTRGTSSTNPRSRHGRYVPTPMNTCWQGIVSSNESTTSSPTFECLPPVVGASKPGASPSPRQPSTKRRGLDVLPPLSPATGRPSVDFAAHCAKLKESRQHSVSMGQNSGWYAVNSPRSVPSPKDHWSRQKLVDGGRTTLYCPHTTTLP